VQKAALALAAVTIAARARTRRDFPRRRDPENSAEALQLLTWLYALVPCILKLGAMGAAGDDAPAGSATGHGLTRGRPDA
jgi:hypothetical protein